MTSHTYWDGILQSRLSRRRVLHFAGAGLASAALAAACGGNSSNSGLGGSEGYKAGGLIYERDMWRQPLELDRAVPGGALTQRVPSDITGSLDMYREGTVSGVAQLVYEPLLRTRSGPGIEPGGAESLEQDAWLSEAYEISPDLLTYTFRLRPGVRFHNLPPVNGREVTIEDWRTSWERLTGDAYPFRTIMRTRVDKTEFPGPRTMVLRFKSPFGPGLYRMGSPNPMAGGLFVMPSELNANPDLAGRTMIGTGFRVLDKVEPSVSRQFRKHDSYWRRKPFIDRWHYPIIPEYANTQAQFLAKNIVEITPQAGDVLRLRTDAPDSVVVGNSPAESLMLMQFGRAQLATSPWNDERVRIGMRRAVDWRGVTDFLSSKAAFSQAGIEVESYTGTHTPPNPAFYRDPAKGELGPESANFLFDLGEAKKLMSAAGYPDGIDIEAFGDAANTNPTISERWQLTLDLYKRSGLFRLRQTLVPRNEWMRTVLTDKVFKGVHLPSNIPGGQPDSFIFSRYHSSRNPVFVDPKMDEYGQAAERTTDVQKLKELVLEFQKYAAKKMYMLPADGTFSTWTLAWPWIHNRYATGDLWWLDSSMPNRRG